MVRRKGFSLLEVLVSFAILTMVLVVLVPEIGLLSRREREAAQRWAAAEIAMSRLAVIAAAGVVVGEAEGRWERYEWSIAVVSDDVSGWSLVTVIASPPSLARPVELSSLIQDMPR